MTQAIRRGLVAFWLLATSAGISAGCSKETQSLLVAELRLTPGSPPAANLDSVTLAAMPGPTKSFHIEELSADTGLSLGLYVPSSVTGIVSVRATAQPVGGGCMGFSGTGTVTIASAGVTYPVFIYMEAADICATDGGAGGNGGTGGTTGAAGTGGTTGVAGTGGATGQAGKGGTTGVGGSTAGTGGGSAGRGGTTGMAGTGGSAGRGGTTGTAGTTGSGGMAGYPAIASCRAFSHAATSGCPSVSVNSIAVSPDGRIVATGGDDNRVKIWNFDGRNLSQTGTVLNNFNGYTVAFSPDGMRFAYTSNPTISTARIVTYMVNGWTAGPTLQDDNSGNSLRGVGFTPDGQRIVSVNAIGFAGGDLFVHNVGGSTLPAYTAHVANEPYALAVAPRAASDGTVGLAVASYYGTVTVFGLGPSGPGTGKDLMASVSNGTTYAVEFSPDGSLLVTGEASGAVRFFNYPLAASPAPVGTAIAFGAGGVNDLAFTPSGTYLSVGGAFGSAQLSIYSVATHMEVDRTTPAEDVASIAFSPSGTALIMGFSSCGTVSVCSN